ncbi:hypothetical protein EYF80_054084 [Liparis tanakae]|uniref:Uncharacterized protein n=1 Tax=Liparis tanakae TaxID=230148 RepID=A0A4Z2F3F4_9TELE|nr:hypothetical protein EYF80_054084 [Liparis tanakae]
MYVLCMLPETKGGRREREREGDDPIGRALVRWASPPANPRAQPRVAQPGVAGATLADLAGHVASPAPPGEVRRPAMLPSPSAQVAPAAPLGGGEEEKLFSALLFLAARSLRERRSAELHVACNPQHTFTGSPPKTSAPPPRTRLLSGSTDTQAALRCGFWFSLVELQPRRGAAVCACRSVSGCWRLIIRLLILRVTAARPGPFAVARGGRWGPARRVENPTVNVPSSIYEAALKSSGAGVLTPMIRRLGGKWHGDASSASPSRRGQNEMLINYRWHLWRRTSAPIWHINLVRGIKPRPGAEPRPRGPEEPPTVTLMRRRSRAGPRRREPPRTRSHGGSITIRQAAAQR